MSGDEEDAMDAIWAEHRTQTAARLDALRRITAAAVAGSLDPAERERGISEAHTLGGAASIFGFDEGTRTAREIERRLREPGSDAAGLDDLAAELTRLLDRDRHARGGPA